MEVRLIRSICFADRRMHWPLVNVFRNLPGRVLHGFVDFLDDLHDLCELRKHILYRDEDIPADIYLVICAIIHIFAETVLL